MKSIKHIIFCCVPIQANYDEDIGPNEDGSVWKINIQPVIPFTLNDEWNLISRTILPFVDAMSRVIAYNSRNPGALFYGEDSQWQKVFLTKSPTFETDTYLDVDSRVTYSQQASFTAKGMVLKFVGKGSQYRSTYKDAQGEWFDGGQNYRRGNPDAGVLLRHTAALGKEVATWRP